MRIIDTHAHLDHVENCDQALKEAAASGVTDVITVGVDLESNRKNLEIIKKSKDPKIHLALGIHPGNIIVEELEETRELIQDNLKDAIAIGETGLDYWYKWVRKDNDKKQEQRDNFEWHLKLAKEHDLPIIIHSRGAWRDCLDMVLEHDLNKVLFHWFSGPVDLLNEVLEKGYFISATPSLAYSPQAREAVLHAPLDRILIETDSPVFYREEEGGFKATPKDVFRTLDIYVQQKGIERDKAAKQLSQNALDFFTV